VHVAQDRKCPIHQQKVRSVEDHVVRVGLGQQHTEEATGAADRHFSQLPRSVYAAKYEHMSGLPLWDMS
jgi:hypothetical protein